MSEMVERLTKIIADHTTECGVISHVPCANGCACQVAARKCVEAMQKPTQAMRTAGANAERMYGMVEDAWVAMIDEALK